MSWYTENATLAKVLAHSYQLGASRTSLTAIFIAILSVAIFFIVFLSSSSSDDTKTHNLGGFYLFIAWKFFSKRYDFMRENFKKTGLKMFRFRLLQVSFYITCIVNSGQLCLSIA